MKITKSTKKVTASKEVVTPKKVASKKVTASKNYKAAEDHIMAAIDCIAKEANNSDAAKDIIANLSVCLFDVKSSTAIKASIELTAEQQEELETIAEKYTTSNPVSGDWDTETASEQKDISDAFGISMDDAKQVMIDYLGFEEDMF